MAVDYRALAGDSARIERIAENSIRTLAELYADRAHFVFELLQNAEDALRRRRRDWRGPRRVEFQLSSQFLRVSHRGAPFSESDVGAICSVRETTKQLTDIGRFGIGFKSVYAFTERPEIHSGMEAFAIEGFIRPVAVKEIERDPEETVILIPLRHGDSAAHADIVSGLSCLGASSLLFLRQVEEIRWSVEGGPSGLYLREAKEIAPGIRRVAVVGQEHGRPEVDEECLVFSRALSTDDGLVAGHVELAWSVAVEEEDGRPRLRRVERSALVVFFPTIRETHLGFLIQGAYRTTPSRDNVPSRDEWNQRCVQTTAELLIEALRWLRDQELLDIAGLRCLPIDRAKFPEGSMFAPLFEATRDALTNEELLPLFDGGYGSAANSRLARTQDLRELLDPTQLSALFGEPAPLHWLSADISQDRTPELRQYLMQELEIAELTPEAVLPKLSAVFLTAQADAWMRRLYEFLSGQPALRQRVRELPLIRLSDGSQVPALIDGQPQAFLPGPVATGFPTVRPAVCESEAARAFLGSLGLTEPDPVDDVIWNVLPKYRADEVDIPDTEYQSDIGRILAAFATDSKAQQEKLVEALRGTSFVMATDPGNAGEYVSKPRELYVSTDRLKELFTCVPAVMLTDDRYACLRGEEVRELLEACGAVRHLRPIPDSSLSWQERADLRERAGHAETSGQNDRVNDWTLLGLEALLKILPTLGGTDRRNRARLLWEELANLEERRGKGAFTGEYRWTHRGSYRTAFDAAFVRTLNESAWVPDEQGNLEQPALILFDSLGWKPNPFLVSKIRFKPPIIDQLAREAGIEPGVLDLLKKHGITSEAELCERLGIRGEPSSENGDEPGDVDEALKRLLGDASPPSPPVPDPAGQEPVAGAGTGTGRGGGSTATAGRGSGSGVGEGKERNGRARGIAQGGGSRTPSRTGGRPFISYVATYPDDEEPDPDDLDQAARMKLETEAIEFTLRREPEWRRTSTHNPGFDLYQGSAPEAAGQWCEVKAMTGTLEDRPVGLSRTQFDCAREHGEAYWLYVVERAGTDDARIVRIQDPAGKATTFTFDHGWRGVAEVDPEVRED